MAPPLNKGGFTSLFPELWELVGKTVADVGDDSNNCGRETLVMLSQGGPVTGPPWAYMSLIFCSISSRVVCF